MKETVAAVYEQGMLRLLTPLSLPERTRVQIKIVAELPSTDEERQRVRQALLEAGVIRPHSQIESVQPVDEAELAAVAKRLASAGSLSQLIIAEREGR